MSTRQKFLTCSFFVLCIHANDIASEDVLLESRCNEMHIGQLKYLNAFIDNATEKYVCFESEIVNDTIYYDYGDSLCKRIVAAYYHKEQDEILPCLIEKVKDTTPAYYYGVTDRQVSDVAIIVTAYILARKYGFKILEFCDREFGTGCDMYNLPYALVFKRNTPEENYRRRLIYYNTIKEIYEKGKRQEE
jgi:hypothetical protein